MKLSRLIIMLPFMAAVFSSCSTQDEVNTYKPWEDKTLTVKQRIESLPDVASVTEITPEESYPQGAYKVMFKLPIDHNDTSKGTFLNKVYIGVQDIDSLNSVWIGGYDEDDLNNKEAIDILLNSNKIDIEHRDFGESYTDTNHDFTYLTTAQAAANQNQILSNLELLFKRRYAISGSSKGGMTVTMLAGYYPERDAVYFPNVAPFVRSVNSFEGHDFILNTVGTAEQRANILKTQRRLLELVKDKDIMAEYKQSLINHHYLPDDLETSVEDIFYYSVQDYGSSIWQCSEYSDSYIPDESLKGKDLWTWARSNQLFCMMPLNILESIRAYWVQGARELGTYGFRDNMSDIYSPTQKVFCKANLPARFQNETYTDETFKKYVDNAVATTKLPMMFLYGGNDPWTAWAIDDKYINGSNVKKYVIPNENHYVDYQSSKMTDEQRAEIRSWIQHYMYSIRQ